MYPLSFDYLDGFSVLVGGDFVIVGGHSVPLGSYAADALNIDEAYLRELSDLARAVEEEFRCYSAARDTLSHALLKEAVRKALLAVYRLLPYQRLYEDRKDRLFSMQSNEELETSALTPGTEEYSAVQEWLERLRDLPRAVERFQRHAHAFLDEFLPDDIERKPAAYAEAYQRYWMYDHLTTFALEDEVFEHSGSDFFFARDNARRELDYRSFPRSFDVNVSFRTTANPKNTQELMMVEEFSFNDWETFVSLDLFRGLAAGHIPRRCQNCGKYFLLDSGYDVRYCGNPAPGANGKTCRQVGAHRKEREANAEDPIRAAYHRVYNRVKTQKSRGKISVDDFNRKVVEAQEIRDNADAGKLTLKEAVAMFEKI